MDEIKILLVDDKENNLLALSTLLERKGRKIYTATSGEDALKLALEHQFGLIMLDVQMPEMDGYEVARFLKSSRRTKDIPIIFVTAISSEDTNILKGFETGAVDFLFKPLNHEITRAKADSFIRLYEQQRQLAEKNEELQKLYTMVENSVSGMCVVKSDKLWIEQFNPAFSKLTGTRREEVNADFLSLFPDEFREEITRKFLKNKKEGSVFSLDAPVVRKNGSETWAGISVTYKGEAWYVSMLDISDKKQAEVQMIRSNLDLEEKVKERTRELTVANREMKEFVGAVSHDLRAPLRGISSLAAWIAEDYSNQLSDEGKENLKLMMHRVHRLDAMIQKVVDFSRIGKNLVTHDETDVNEVLNDILKHYRQEERNKIKLQGELPTIRFNQDFLKKVFSELIDNALRFVDPEKGRISIGSIPGDHEWQFFVEDNGEGLTKTQVNEIFKVFYTNNPSGQDLKHVGMGLPQVKKILSMKNGRIWAESKPGEGTRLVFTIPHQRFLTPVS